jgi:Fe2+ transport system protein B
VSQKEAAELQEKARRDAQELKEQKERVSQAERQHQVALEAGEAQLKTLQAQLEEANRTTTELSAQRDQQAEELDRLEQRAAAVPKDAGAEEEQKRLILEQAAQIDQQLAQQNGKVASLQQHVQELEGSLNQQTLARHFCLLSFVALLPSIALLASIYGFLFHFFSPCLCLRVLVFSLFSPISCSGHSSHAGLFVWLTLDLVGMICRTASKSDRR